MGVSSNGSVADKCLGVALQALALNLSPGVVAEDGSKLPGMGKWKQYQTKAATEQTVNRWFQGGRTGVGLFTGHGNLECLEFDDLEVFNRFAEAATVFGLAELVERIRHGYTESSPGGGIHWLYRCEKLDGNTKLAERPKPTEKNPQGREPLIETRGAGGWIVIAPSNGKVHPSGGAYTLLSGGLDTIATITPDEREGLFSLARSFDEIPEETTGEPEPARQIDGPTSHGEGGVRPGDDFNARAKLADIIEPFGWTRVHVSGGVEYWRRPDKDLGWSATWGKTKGFRVFSSSTSLEARSHSLLYVYCKLNHKGDWKACIKDLVKQGYGTWIDDKGHEHQNPRPDAPRTAVKNATAKKNGAAPPSVNGTDDRQHGQEDPRPAIEINTQRHIVLEATLKALGTDLDLYCRGKSLGIVIAEESDTAKLSGGVELHHARGNLRFVPLAPTVLGCRLTCLASFYRWKADKKGELIAVDTHPPDWLIGAIADHQYWPGVRQLLTITECPYVMAGGTLATPGFDRATGTLYRPSFAVPPVPKAPTRADASRAVDVLYDLVSQFPFEDMHSFAVWLANLLTCIQRPTIAGPVPGFVYNGNAAGCGKGLLIDLLGNLVWGSNVGTRTYPADPNEAAKVKLALALAAVPIVHFDNLNEGGFYGGGVMDSAITSTVASDRILGQSRDSGNVPLRPVWTASGNNVSPYKDADRRWLPCNLATELERPHERGDLVRKNLRGYTLEHRGELVRAALVILRVHSLAGRPVGPSSDSDNPDPEWPPLGSFEEWDPVVRGAVWYATGLDCLVTQRQGSAEKPDRLNKAALLLGWKEIDPGGFGKTIEEAIAMAANHPDQCPTLRSALLNISRDGKLPSVDKVKYKVRSMKKTPINRMRFEACGEDRTGARLWKVVAC